MHVLILTQYFPPEIGAAQARLEFYANHFRQAGHRVTVVTTFPNYPNGVIMSGYRNRLFAREDWQGIEILRTWIWLSGGKSFGARLLWFLSFMVTGVFGGLLVKRPDVIFVENPPIFTGVTAFFLGSLRRAPIVTHVSDMWVDAAVNFGFLMPGPSLTLARVLERFVLSASARLVTVSERCERQLRAIAPQARIHMIPNGVNTALFRRRPVDEALRRSLGLDGKFTVIYAGTLGFQHGLEVVVEAATLLGQTAPNVQFLIVGEGSEKERIQRLAAEAMTRNITFISQQPQDRLVDYLCLSQVGLSTLKGAEFTAGVRPVKLYTFMACKLPVVATDVGESAAIIRAAGCGVLVPADDAFALAKAITQLKDLPVSELAALGRVGRPFVEKHYSRAKSAEELLVVMAEVISRGAVATAQPVETSVASSRAQQGGPKY